MAAATPSFSVFLLAAAAICLVLLPHSAHATPVDFEYCGNEAFYRVKVHQVDVSPDPAVLNRPITFNFSASADETIEFAEVTVEVTYATLLLYSETRELCRVIHCPIPSGNFAFSKVQTLKLPTYPLYTVKMMLWEYGRDLTCITFQLAFGSMLSYKNIDRVQ